MGPIGYIFKYLINRPRPQPGQVLFIWHPGLESGSKSFPSGHVEFYIAALGFLFLVSKNLLVRGFCLFMILAIGFSRLYSGEHWFLDVLAGYLIGGLWLGVSVAVYRQAHKES